MKFSLLALSLGVFVGWLIVPLITKIPMKDGVFIGFIAAIICFIIGKIFFNY